MDPFVEPAQIVRLDLTPQPLSVPQSEILLAQKFDLDNPALHLAEYLESFGSIYPVLFSKAVPILRIPLAAVGGSPCQYPVPDKNWELPVVDVSTETDPRGAAKARMLQDMATIDDPIEDPCFAATFIILALSHFVITRSPIALRFVTLAQKFPRNGSRHFTEFSRTTDP